MPSLPPLLPLSANLSRVVAGVRVSSAVVQIWKLLAEVMNVHMMMVPPSDDGHSGDGVPIS